MKDSRKISLLAVLLFVNTLFALPEGTVSVQGGGSFDISGKNMIIEAPDGSIFEHQSFDVGVDESVQFNQPGKSSRVLNRITTPSPSFIDGQISANGEVYLVNPSGVIFGTGAVIEAARLHAIAGTLSNNDFSNGNDNFTSLEAQVSNEGTIGAEHITLAGSSVVNAGTLNATAGSAILSAGGSMYVTSTDGFLNVSISPDSTAPLGAATDLIGQTLLNSGTINAVETHLLGNTITNSGSVKSEKVLLSGFSTVDAVNGTFLASEMNVLGSTDNLAGQDVSLLPDVFINSKGNKVSEFQPTGSFARVSFRSSQATTVGEVPQYLSRGFVSIGEVDFRVTGGELSLGLTFSPLLNYQAPSLLLATKEDLNLGNGIENVLSTYQLLLFGKSMFETSYSAIESPPANLFFANGNSLSVEDLSIGLDAESVYQLSADNPGATAFSMPNGQPLEISEYNSPGVSSSSGLSFSPLSEAPANLPTGNSPTQPSGQPVAIPSSSSPSQLANSDGPLTFEQLEIAMANGLFANHSYYLQSSPKNQVMINKFENFGGSSFVYGGNYLVAKPTTFPPFDEPISEDFYNEDTNSTVVIGEDIVSGAGDFQVGGVVSFSPITTPVLSKDASETLRKALNPMVESKLKNFIRP